MACLLCLCFATIFIYHPSVIAFVGRQLIRGLLLLLLLLLFYSFLKLKREQALTGSFSFPPEVSSSSFSPFAPAKIFCWRRDWAKEGKKLSPGNDSTAPWKTRKKVGVGKGRRKLFLWFLLHPSSRARKQLTISFYYFPRKLTSLLKLLDFPSVILLFIYACLSVCRASSQAVFLPAARIASARFFQLSLPSLFLVCAWFKRKPKRNWRKKPFCIYGHANVTEKEFSLLLDTLTSYGNMYLLWIVDSENWFL